MPGAFDVAAIALLAMAGVALSVGITWFVASQWKNRCGISYAIAAAAFYVVFFTAAFEYGILDAIRLGKTVPSDMVDTLLLGHAAITAFGVTVLTLLVFGLFVGLRPPLEGSRDQMRAYTGCAAFCLILTSLLNPVGAVERLRSSPDGPLRMAFTAPMPQRADPVERKPDRRAFVVEVESEGETTWKGPLVFPPPGLVRRVQVRGSRITHFIVGEVGKRIGLDMEDYARIALAQRLYFDGGKPGPVVLRDAATRNLLATRHPSGGFRWQIANRKHRRK